MRGHWGRRIPAALLVLLVLSAPSSQAAGDDPFVEARALLAAAEGTPAQIFEAMMRAQGLAVNETHRTATIDRRTRLGAVTDRVLTAIGVAEDLRRRSIEALSPSERAAILDRLHVAVSDDGAGTETTSTLAVRDIHLDPAVIAAAGKVNMNLMRRGAAILLAAIDDVAPALTASGLASVTASSSCGVAGEVLYESDDCSVIVGGSGANTYPDGIDPALLLDVGGDDVYENDTAVGLTEVRVVVDAAGDDTYARSVGHIDQGTGVLATYGQGVGALGVGVLADLGGDDTYAVSLASSAPEPGPAARAAQATGQGAGIAGVGVLADVGGADSFLLRSSSTGGAATSFGQGHGLAFGLGVLISADGPGGDSGDTYAASSVSTRHTIETTSSFSRFAMGTAASLAQGTSEAFSSGMLIEAGGNDVYDIAATGASARATGHGGTALGAALLVDVDGDDTMMIRATGNADLELVTTDPSLCWSATVNVTTATTEAIGQGGGRGDAPPMLIDGGGNDERSLIASSAATARTIVSSNASCGNTGGNKATATAATGDGIALGQGAGGVLLDVGGNDTNALHASSEAHATAKVSAPGSRTETATATPGASLARGQGATTGIAADLLGDDGYIARSRTAKSEVTSTIGSATEANGTVQVHGWGPQGRFVDLGGDDVYDAGPGSAAANDSCWSNAGGRGSDLPAGAPPPSCP